MEGKIFTQKWPDRGKIAKNDPKKEKVHNNQNK